ARFLEVVRREAELSQRLITAPPQREATRAPGLQHAIATFGGEARERLRASIDEQPRQCILEQTEQLVEVDLCLGRRARERAVDGVRDGDRSGSLRGDHASG